MAIVAAVDSSDRAVAVIEQANDLAERYDVGLHVVHVADPTVDFREDFTDVSAEALRSPTGKVSERVVEEVQQTASEIAADAAREVAAIDDYEAVGLIGDPSTVVRQYASEHDAEYVVVSGRKRRPLGQALFGSVTQSLLLNADCPVVAVPHDP